jgi:phosphoribosylformylglycinamidine cyclo-ligase
VHRLVNPKTRLSVGDRLGPGDAIVLLDSSGIHANGLSLARKLVERLPQGWLTEVAPGLSYGEALLAPTVLYSPVTEALWQAGITPHYCANITGHGWRKLLRHAGPLHLPHPHRAARCRRCWPSSSSMPATTTARPTAR